MLVVVPPPPFVAAYAGTPIRLATETVQNIKRIECALRLKRGMTSSSIFFRATFPQSTVAFVRCDRVLSAVHSLFFRRRSGRGRLLCAGRTLRADRAAQISFHSSRPGWSSDGPFRTSIATTPLGSGRSFDLAYWRRILTSIVTFYLVAFLARAVKCLAVERFGFCFGDAVRRGKRGVTICGE